MGEVARIAEENISFGEYADKVGMSAKRKAGFRASLDLAGEGFNYRSERQWDSLYRQFLGADRRRRI